MRNKLAKYSKWSLLLVIIGFFMPISCDANGFRIGSFLMSSGAFGYGILLFAVFASAVISFLITFLHKDDKDEEPIGIDWFLLIAGIASGSFTAYAMRETTQLQSGAYVIICGWILSFIFLLKATFSKD